MKHFLFCIALTLATFCPATKVRAARVTLQSVSVAPSSASILVGASQQFSATAHYSNGTTANVTASATWTSSSTAVATVSGGLAQGASAGSTTIKATYSAKVGSAALTVNG